MLFLFVSCVDLSSLTWDCSGSDAPKTEVHSLFTIPGDASCEIFFGLLVGAGVLGIIVFTAGFGRSPIPSSSTSVSSTFEVKFSSNS